MIIGLARSFCMLQHRGGSKIFKKGELVHGDGAMLRGWGVGKREGGLHGKP